MAFVPLYPPRSRPMPGARVCARVVMSATPTPDPSTPLSSTPLSSTPMSSTPPSSTPASSTPASSTPAGERDDASDEAYSAPPLELDLDPDVLRDRALSAMSDVGQRPLYYSKIVAYVAGVAVLLTILGAVVDAVDRLPVLPAALELIGLGYTAWFVWRYVLFKESRQELVSEIDDFLGRARPRQDDQ